MGGNRDGSPIRLAERIGEPNFPSTPPAEMVFFNGDFFTARVALESLIKTAKKRAIIIDHYIDAKTFDIFDVRQPGVTGIIRRKSGEEIGTVL